MQKKRLIIHAGMHKTGTSAIQNYLYEHFAHDTIEYLSRDIANSSLWMIQAFQGNADPQTDSGDSLSASGELTEVRGAAREQLHIAIHQSTKPVHVISAESIATFSGEELQGFHDFVSPFYETVSIHQYVRPMKSWMESAFQEKLKDGFTRLTDKVGLNYFTRVQMLDAVFGQENVYNYGYTSCNALSGGVVNHFLSELGIEPDSRTFAKANAGLSFHAVQLLYIYRMHYPVYEPGDAIILQKLSEIPGSALRFHSKLYTETLITGPTSIVRFEARAGFSISEDLTADDINGVAVEQDLLEIPPASIDWLSHQIGISASMPQLARNDLPAIAEAVRALGAASNKHAIAAGSE